MEALQKIGFSPVNSHQIGVKSNEVSVAPNITQNTLERAPKADEVHFKGQSKNNIGRAEIPLEFINNEMSKYKFNVPCNPSRASEMTSQSGLDLKISNGFMGMQKRTIKGKHGTDVIELKLGDGFLNHTKGTLKGKIGDAEYDIKYRFKDNETLVIEGKGVDQYNTTLNSLLSVLILNNIGYNLQRDN